MMEKYNGLIKYKILSEYTNKIINATDYNSSLIILNEALELTNDNIEQSLLNSLINKDRYNISMDFHKLKLYFDVLDIIYYYNDAEKIIEDIEKNITDTTQINTLRRIIKNKQIRQQSNDNNDNNYTDTNNNNSVISSKQCPHCNNRNYGSIGSPYVICGYTVRGFDWKGCGKDWCFKCEKKLCKCWNNDSLFNTLNRYHDAKCCKNFASKIGLKYPDDFCMCYNDIVKR